MTDQPQAQNFPAGQVQPGQCIVPDNASVVEITSIRQSDPSKHGTSRVEITGLNLQTGKNYTGTYDAATSILVITVATITRTVIDVEGTELIIQDGDDPIDSVHADPLSVNSVTLDTIREALAAGGTCTVTIRRGPGFLELSGLNQAGS